MVGRGVDQIYWRGWSEKHGRRNDKRGGDAENYRGTCGAARLWSGHNDSKGHRGQYEIHPTQKAKRNPNTYLNYADFNEKPAVIACSVLTEKYNQAAKAEHEMWVLLKYRTSVCVHDCTIKLGIIINPIAQRVTDPLVETLQVTSIIRGLRNQSFSSHQYKFGHSKIANTRSCS